MYYTITGVCDGEHYCATVQADNWVTAETMFKNYCVSEIASSEGLALSDIDHEYFSAWIISVVETYEMPKHTLCPQ